MIPHGPRLVDSVVFLTPQSPSVLPQLFHKSLQAPPDVWLWVSASVSISCWMKLLRRQFSQGPVCKHSEVSLIVSGDGSLEIGLNLGQSLVGCSLCLCSIFIPEHLVGKTHFMFTVLSMDRCHPPFSGRSKKACWASVHSDSSSLLGMSGDLKAPFTVTTPTLLIQWRERLAVDLGERSAQLLLSAVLCRGCQYGGS